VRSPLGEALLRARVDAACVEVSSYGTLELRRQPAVADAIVVGRGLGVDLGGHRSRPLPVGALQGADMVVGFEASHVAAAITTGHADPRRSFMMFEILDLLEELSLPPSLSGVDRARQAVEEMHRRRTSGIYPTPQPVLDPYGQPRHVLAETARVIDAFASFLAFELFDSSVMSEGAASLR
jgi:protein-tyrosine-phosphatase